MTALLFFCTMNKPSDNFRKIATRLILISVVTAGIVGVYLWYNFNARSRLLMIMPENTQWFAHLQTRQARQHLESLPGMKRPPAMLDSLSAELSASVAFQELEDPGQLGVGLMSDALVFGTPSGWFFALSLSSEAKFKAFLGTQVAKSRVGALIQKPNYTYARLMQRQVFVAYQFKAMVLYVPRDTAASAADVERGIAEVFSGEPSDFLQSEAVQNLYQDEPDFLWYNRAESAQSFAVYLDEPMARIRQMVVYQRNGQEPPFAVSPLRFFAEAERGFAGSRLELTPDRWLQADNQIKSGDYANLLIGWVWERLSLWNEQSRASRN
jgi:hypothetical protein